MPLTCQRIDNRAFSVVIGCRQNSSNCDRQRHSDKNSRLICSVCL